MAQASPVNFYTTHTPENLEDAHPVHGCITSDGSYIAVGKGVESISTGIRRAFAVAMSSTGTKLWQWTTPVNGVSDAANAVVALPDNLHVVVVGFKSVGGVYKRSITKLAIADGSEVWTATWDSPNPANQGAWENVDITTDKASIILTGLQDNECGQGGFTFKSCTSERAEQNASV